MLNEEGRPVFVLHSAFIFLHFLLRQSSLQKRNPIAHLAQQPVQHPAVFGVADVFDLAPKFPSIQLELLNLGNHI